jgi:threonine/homoserine/homoserine lactone efflux protein
LAIPLAVAGGIYLLYAFSDKFKDWRASLQEEPVAKPWLSFEIDRSSVE